MSRFGQTIGRRLLCLMLAGWLAACGATPGEPRVGSGPPSLSRAELDQARDLWRASAVPSYRLVVEVQAASGVTCAGEVEVENEIVQRANLPSGRPACGMAHALTVTRLFELVERGLLDQAQGRLSRFDVLFDGHTGVPITIEIAERPSHRLTRYLVRHVIPSS